MGCVPTPEIASISGLSDALSVTTSEAVRLPSAVGTNWMLTRQEVLGTMVAPLQVLPATGKSPTFAPAVVTVEMIRFSAPELVIVTVLLPLDVPRFLSLKTKGLGEILTAGASPTPLMLMSADC